MALQKKNGAPNKKSNAQKKKWRSKKKNDTPDKKMRKLIFPVFSGGFYKYYNFLQKIYYLYTFNVISVHSI
jgi:hypothetical protein